MLHSERGRLASRAIGLISFSLTVRSWIGVLRRRFELFVHFIWPRWEDRELQFPVSLRLDKREQTANPAEISLRVAAHFFHHGCVARVSVGPLLVRLPP